jgi:hypothetical protein
MMKRVKEGLSLMCGGWCSGIAFNCILWSLSAAPALFPGLKCHWAFKSPEDLGESYGYSMLFGAKQPSF